MLQITLPDELGELVARDATQEGYDNVEAYVVEAMRALHERKEAERRREAKLLRQALESGEPVHADDKWWEDFIADCNAKALEAAKKENA